MELCNLDCYYNYLNDNYYYDICCYFAYKVLLVDSSDCVVLVDNIDHSAELVVEYLNYDYYYYNFDIDCCMVYLTVDLALVEMTVCIVAAVVANQVIVKLVVVHYFHSLIVMEELLLEY